MSTGKRPLKSKVWGHFEPPTTANPSVTICKECNKQLSYNSASTSAMARHLETKHNIDFNQPEISTHPSTSNQPNEQFFPKQSIDSASEAIARCLVDGIPINTIINSEILKDYLDKVHHLQMPKTKKEFNKIIKEYYNQVVEKFKLLFEHLKRKNGKISITLDRVRMKLFKTIGYTEDLTIIKVHCNVESKIESFMLECSSYFSRVEETLKKFGLDLNTPIVDRTQKDEINMREAKIDICGSNFIYASIIDNLIFLKCYFLNKVKITNNEQVRDQKTVVKLSSQVWQYFSFKPDNPKVTICQVPITNPITSSNVKCNKSMSYSSSSTSAMARHLKSQHNIDIDLLNNQSKSNPITVKQTSAFFNTQYTTKENLLGDILSRCASDGIPISTIAYSLIIKDYLNKVHHIKMPNSEEEIKELIVQFYIQAVDEYRNMFEHFKSNGARFSLTLNSSDEFNVYCQVDSKIEAFYLENTWEPSDLNRTLRIFGLDLNSDIVASTQILLHSGLIKDLNNFENSFNIIIKHSCIKRAIKRAVLASTKDIWEYTSNLYIFFQFIQKYQNVFLEQKIELPDYGFDWISNVRMAELLLKQNSYIKKVFDNIKLILDVRSDYKMNGILGDGLLDYPKSEIYYDEHKFDELKKFVYCLKPLEEAHAELENPNSNLLAAEVVMKYVFLKLREMDSDLSRKLVDELNVEYKKIRNQNIVSLMYFLKHRKYPIEGFESFEYSSKDEIIEIANELNHRLFPNKYPSKQTQSTNSPNSSHSPTLIDFLNSEMCDTQDVHLDDNLTTHFDSAEKTKTLTPQLERLNSALMSIRPSVVEMETKLIGWSDDQIEKKIQLHDKLIFLKHYFTRKSASLNQVKEIQTCQSLKESRSTKKWKLVVDNKLNLKLTILSCSMNQNSKGENGLNGSNQCVAMNISSIICSSFKPISEWNQAVMENILRQGDKLYLETIQRKNLEIGSLLKVHDFEREIHLFDRKFTMTFNMSYDGEAPSWRCGYIEKRDVSSRTRLSPTLTDVIKEFFWSTKNLDFPEQ